MLLIFGSGYCGGWLAAAARARGMAVTAIGRTAAGDTPGSADPAVAGLIMAARWIVSTAPPAADAGDPILAHHRAALGSTRAFRCYLSSTGVYGDAGGAFVDEDSPTIGAGAGGRRWQRALADAAWRALGATVLRLPGIYGPGRSAFDQLAAGTLRRIDRPGHRFSRIHVADIAGAILAAMARETDGVFNLADELPAEPRDLAEEACRLAGAPLPPLVPLEAAALSPAAAGFWAERRLVSGLRFRRATGYRLRHPDYRAGLRAIHAGEMLPWPTGF